MRRTFIFALSLLAVPAIFAAGSSVHPAQAHRRAVTGARSARSQAASRTGSHKTSRRTGQHTKSLHPTSAAARKVRYTPERSRKRAHEATGASPTNAAGSRNGYDAGRTAALRPLAGDGAGVKLTGHNSDAFQAGEESFETREASATRQPATDLSNDRLAADKPYLAPALSETTETENPETPPLDEIASVHASRAGMPHSLRGSLESLERQNTRADGDGLERIEDEADLSNRIEHKLLVPLPASPALNVNPGLPDHNRYCRPWTARFLADLASAHQAAFHKPIEVNSAVRTVEYQKRLMRTNGNAAAAEGEIVSPHLTGATVDIAKQGLSRQEMVWMRRQLLGMQQAGKIDVEEEFEQACFHITVYKTYATQPPPLETGQSATSQGSASRHKARQPVHKPSSQPPADMAAGESPAQGR